jgi:hypothetical protein
MAGPRHDPGGEWERPPPRRGNGAPARAPTPTTSVVVNMDSATIPPANAAVSTHLHPGALAVLGTTTRQLDGLAALGANAELHGVVIPQVTWVAAVDGIAQRQRAALHVIDLREQVA